MLVSFTQTYGSRRTELHKIHLKDKRLLELKSLFDLNIYSFHNVPWNQRADFVSGLPFTNWEVMLHAKCSYADCIRVLLSRLKSVGATHFMFMQDDTFSNFNDTIAWEDLFYIVESHKKDFLLSLAHNSALFEEREPAIKTLTLNLYNGLMEDWIGLGLWAMDDQPYICTIDVLDKLFDDEYWTRSNVWDMEIYLKNKWEKKPDTPRHFTNKALFKNYNILGNTISKKKIWRERLKEKGLI